MLFVRIQAALRHQSDPQRGIQLGVRLQGLALLEWVWVLPAGKKEMALINVWNSISDEICGCERLPGTVRSASATATDLVPRQLRWCWLLHWWAPRCLCSWWQTPPGGEDKKESWVWRNGYLRNQLWLRKLLVYHSSSPLLLHWHRRYFVLLVQASPKGE